MRQSRLQFEIKKNPQTQAAEATNATESLQQAPQTAPAEDMRALLLEVRQGFASIADKMDTLTTRMDTIVRKIDGHETRIKETEQRISTTEDATAHLQKSITQMDKLLKVIAAKNEDIEARSRRSSRKHQHRQDGGLC